MKTFKDTITIIIAVFAIALFGAAFVACYVGAFMSFSVASILAGALASLIPGLFCYGIASATLDFMQKDFGWKPGDMFENLPGLKTIFTLLIAVLAIVLFGGATVFCYVMAVKYFSVASIIAAVIASLIPGLICYSCMCATAQYVKELLNN